jgi:hypothetical protein
MPQDLIDGLPGGLDKKLRELLIAGESVEIQLKGAWKEALVCTDRRVLILKSGFMTGQTFGSNAFQVPYTNVATVEVKFHLMTGYFELSAGGMQNVGKSYWSTNKDSDPSKAPNCISLNSRAQAARFRSACTFIMEKVGASHQPQVSAPPPAANPTESASSVIERLWKLRTDGAISQEEFEIMKQEALARVQSGP